jgi:glyoxylate utilization-related uncharacterized protein
MILAWRRAVSGCKRGFPALPEGEPLGPYEEILVVLEGEIEVIVDGRQERIPGGSIRIIPPRAWHQFTNRTDHACLMVNVHSSPRLIQENWSDRVRESEVEDDGAIS